MWLRWGTLCGYKQRTFGAFLVFCIAKASGLGYRELHTWELDTIALGG